MAFKMEQLIQACSEMDDQIQHILEGIQTVRQDINLLEQRLQPSPDNQPCSMQSLTRIRSLITNQESLCSNVRVFKDLLTEGFRMISQQKQTSDRNEIERLNSDLTKQYAINMNMKREVLELNELITDHIQMSRKKLEERDAEIVAWKKKYQKLLEVNMGGSIKIEEDQKKQTDHQVEQQQRHSLQTIKEESQQNNSNLKTDERQESHNDGNNNEFRFDDPIPSTHIDFSTQCSRQSTRKIETENIKPSANEIMIEEARTPSILRTEESQRSQKSSSKNKIKYFIDDFRRASGSLENRDDSQIDIAIPTPSSMRKNAKNLSQSRKCQTSIILQPYQEPYCPPNQNPANPSNNLSSSSSHSHLSIAQNENDGLWLPYKNISPKKLDFSRNKNPWKMINRKSTPSKEQNGLSQIRINNENLFVPAQSSVPKVRSARKQQKIFVNPKKEEPIAQPPTFLRLASSASKDKLREVDQNNMSRASRPNSKQKLTVTIKNHESNHMNSAQSLRRPQRKATPQKNYPIQMQYLQRLDLQVGVSTEDLRYEGPRRQGQRNGNGRLQYSSGVFYQGEFKDNVRHGYGVLSVNGKVVYSGDWQRDKICGSGTIKNMHLIHRPHKLTDPGFLSFLREAWYSGEFQQNRFHGNGTLFSSGQKIIGRFHDGHLEGEYSYCKKDGRVELCRFDLHEMARTILQYHR